MGTVVLLTSAFARWRYLPTFAERHIEAAEQKSEFDVVEPGIWFSVWPLGDGQAYAMIAAYPSGELLATNISEAATNSPDRDTAGLRGRRHWVMSARGYT